MEKREGGFPRQGVGSFEMDSAETNEASQVTTRQCKDCLSSTGKGGNSMMQHQSILNKRKVIVAGGYASDGEKASAEMYNPQMDTWIDLPSLPTQRIDFKLKVFFHSHLLQLNFSIFLPFRSGFRQCCDSFRWLLL